jgi:RNA polymerase sigma-70 factor (ECF subfamily)
VDNVEPSESQLTVESDSELMIRVRQGRVAALGELFERHHAALYRFCLRMCGNRAESEDLVQDVFMKMLKHRESFKADAGFLPWMYRIAHNVAVDYLRRSSRTSSTEADLETRPADLQPSDEGVIDKERTGLLRRALLELPPDRREVLLLSRYELKSYEEVATALGVSVGTVKTRAHRAIKQLREVYLGLLQQKGVTP